MRVRQDASQRRCGEILMASKTPKPENLVPLVRLIRGEKALLDSDLATLYGVSTKVLNQAVKRNVDRFPESFMFRLSAGEWDRLRSQIVTLKRGMNIKYRPNVFTEQGIAMLSSVLKSDRAILVNVEIMRAFVKTIWLQRDER
jgi:hypothetical protein